MSIKDFKVECDNANNSPLKKPEFVDLTAENSNKKDKDKGDKNT